MTLEKTGVELIADNKAKFLGDLGDANKAIRSFGDVANDSAKHFSKFGDITTGALREVGAMGVNVFADAGKALVGFGVDSIDVAADFEQGLGKFRAAAGLSADEVEKFKDQFIALGRELPVSTLEVSRAATELVSGGIDPATVAAGGLRQSLQFAAAAGLSLEDAAIISAKAVGGWTKITDDATTKADFLTQATNVLTQASLASSTTVDQLALGLYNVQGTAKAAGVSFDETVTTLAQLAPSFASSAEAGNSLKNFLIRLQPATKPATDAMRDLGLYTDATGSAFYDSAGNFVGMEKAAGLLQTAMAGLTNEQKLSYLQTIFQQDAMGTANVLVEQGAAGYAAMAQKLSEQNDVQKAAAIQQDNFNTALDNAKGSVEALQLTFVTNFLPMLTDLVNNYVAPAINAVTDFADVIAKSEDPLATIGAKINEVLPGFSSFASFVGDHLNPILAGIATVITVAVVPALVSMTLAALPIVVALGTIGAAGALLYEAWTTDWNGIQTSLTNFWTTTGQPIFSDVTTWLSVNIPAGIQLVSDFWTGTLVPALSTAWSYFTTNILPVLQDVYTEVATNLPRGIQVVSDFWTGTLVPAITTAWDYFSKNILPVFADVYEEVATHLPAGLQVLSDYWTNTLYPAIEEAWTFFDQHIVPLFKSLVDVEIAALNIAIDTLAGFWDKTLLPAITKIYDFINTKIIPIFVDADTKALGPLNTASQVLSDMWSLTLFGSLSSVYTFISDKLTSAFGGLGGAIDKVTSMAKGLADMLSGLSLPKDFTPGSPMPLETAFWGLRDAIKSVATDALPQLQIGLDLDDRNVAALTMPAQQQTIRPPATLGQMMMAQPQQVTNYGPSFNLTAQYQQQERPSLIQDVRTLQTLFG